MAAKLLASGVPSNEVQRRILEENLFDVQALESRKTLAKVVLQRLEGIESFSKFG